MSPGSILHISQPWAVDSGAVVDVDAVQVFPIVPSTFARIEGGELTLQSGSAVNVNSGRLEVDADLTVQNGAVIDVMDNATLELNGTANVNDGSAMSAKTPRS